MTPEECDLLRVDRDRLAGEVRELLRERVMYAQQIARLEAELERLPEVPDYWPPSSWGPYVALRLFARQLVSLGLPSAAEARRLITVDDVIQLAKNALAARKDDAPPTSQVLISPAVVREEALRASVPGAGVEPSTSTGITREAVSGDAGGQEGPSWTGVDQT